MPDEIEELRRRITELEVAISTGTTNQVFLGETAEFVAMNVAGGGGSVDNGCFKIVAGTDQGGNACHYFDNQYVAYGNVLHAVNLPCTKSIEAFVDDGTPVVGVQVTMTNLYAEVVGYASVSALIADSSAQTKIVVPLYEFDTDASVKIDFRAVPRVQVFEMVG